MRACLFLEGCHASAQQFKVSHYRLCVTAGYPLCLDFGLRLAELQDKRLDLLDKALELLCHRQALPCYDFVFIHKLTTRGETRAPETVGRRTPLFAGGGSRTVEYATAPPLPSNGELGLDAQYNRTLVRRVSVRRLELVHGSRAPRHVALGVS